MAKFVFRLQSLLGLKEKLESQKEIEYGLAIKKLEEEREKERLLKQRQADTLAGFTKQLETKIEPASIAQYNYFLEVLKEWIAAQETAVAAAVQFVEEKRLELVEAMRERKSLEKLKENDLEAFIEEEKHDEQKQVDAVVSYKYGR